MTETWNEDSSALYRRLAAVAVPMRAEQIAALLTLIPFAPGDSFRVVELSPGQGLLADAILLAYPNASLLALDYSESMREATAARLAPHGDRAAVGPYDMFDDDWYDQVNDADVVVSSLAFHHLTDEDKAALYREIAHRLSPRGALLLADLVRPQRPEVRALFAATWDAVTEAQARTTDPGLFDLFRQERWNLFEYDDPFDKPSALADQLRWLSEAGFPVVDCFWMQAGHAIYGGYRQPADPQGQPSLAYADAIRVAASVLDATT